MVSRVFAVRLSTSAEVNSLVSIGGSTSQVSQSMEPVSKIRKPTLNTNGASIESPRAGRQDMRVILRHNRHHRRARFHRQMEPAFLERQHLGGIRVTAGSLGEDKDALAIEAHFIRSAVERLEGRFAVRAVDKHRAGEGHEPAQERDCGERLLGRDAAVGREYGAEHEHVELGLVVADEHRRASGEVLDALDNVEPHPRRVPHDPFEAAGGGPL